MSLSVVLTNALRTAFSPRGRLSRRYFWFGCLLSWGLFWIAFELLDGLAAIDLTRLPAFVLLWVLYCLCARRYHDLDRTAAWLWLLLVPLIGVVWVCVQLGFFRGSVGENSFGIDPRDLRQTARDYAGVQ